MIASLEGRYIDGLFSHLPRRRADKESARLQIQRFKRFNDLLRDEGIHIPIRHISNSAGVIEFPEAEYDMVRCGIVTYGIYPLMK